MSLTWKAPASGDPAAYLVEFGDAPGSTYLGTVDTGRSDTSLSRRATPGIEFVRVRAKNACGVGAPSRELRVAVDPEHMNPRTDPDVVVARRTPRRNTYFPTAHSMSNGEIAVVYYDSPDHVSQAGRISIVRSADQGRTWSAPSVVVDGPLDERDPSIVETANGTWIVNYFASDESAVPASQGVFVVRSSDRGYTWSEPIRIDTPLIGAGTSAKIVQLDDGDLLLPIYGSPDATDAHADIVRSSDDGRTWPRDTEVTIAARAGVSFVEPAIASFGGGRLLAMMRTEGAERNAYESYSTDGGRTWSPPERTSLVAQASDLLPIVDAPDRLLLVHAWGDTSGRFGDSRPTVMQVTRIREFPSARSSGEPRLLHQGHCWADEGYPSSVRLRDGRVLTIYYDACAGYIGGTFSELRDPASIEPCGDHPPAPTHVKAALSAGGVATVSWQRASAAEVSYVLEAGRSEGAADVITIDVGPQTIYHAPDVAPGTYYVRVRARNACGAGAASDDVVMVVR